MALTGTRSGRTGGRGGQLNAAPASVILALTLLLLAACSEDSSPTVEPPPSSSTFVTTAASTTPTTADRAVEIVARYNRFWAVRFDANQVPPNPDAPALADYATGQQLEQVRAETRKNLQDRVAVRHASTSIRRSSAKVVDLAADEATVQECVVDDDVVYRYSTGEVINADVATHSVEATMQRVDGVWKLASARLLQRWEGVAGCALSGDF